MSADTLILERRTALTDIVEHLERKPTEHLRAALAEVSAALADVVALIDKPKDDSAIVAAIGRLKLAPVVHVAAPQVVVQVPAGSLVTQIVFNTDKFGNIKTADLIRSTA